jgi:L-ascorbate metabolism protein UlaG (beta-lactamase superfamily)
MPRYANFDGTTPDKGFGEVLRWRASRLKTGRHREGRDFVTPRQSNDGRALLSPEPRLTWIGHATFVQRLGGKLIATDPIWSQAIQGFIRRRTPPGVALEEMPPVDVVTISHSHYDHLDLPTLRQLGNDAIYVLPSGNGSILEAQRFAQIVELGWWDTFRPPGGRVAITLVPAQHWSMRTPWDRNKRLWGGFVYEGPEGTSYHAGDTAFSEAMFRKIGERFPRIDWAMLPIGAYEPEWFMKQQHMGPEEAGRAWELLGAKNLCAMHWGTFDLTDEPPAEPPTRLRAWWKERGLDPERLWIFDVGETRGLTGGRGPESVRSNKI